MKVVLVAAEFEENLAVRYLWGALAREGHEVRLIVFNAAGDTERAARELVDSGARLAGFSMVFTRRAREFADLAVRARSLGFGGHITAGGHFAAFNAERLLADVPAMDSVVVGEGEGPLCGLAARIGDPASVEGLVWRDGGRTRRNAPAAKPADLDTLAPPVHKDPPDRYVRLPIVNVLGSRGCTRACAFCSIAAWHRLCGGDRLRLRSPEAVAEEMAGLYRKGVRIFNFHDDDFVPPDREAAFERVRALRRELEARGVGRIAFAVKCRPDAADAELLAEMRSMGLFRVFLGLEAGTAESLRSLGRGQTRDDNVRALDVVERLGLHACFNLLLFNPDSTLEDVAGNVAFLAAHARNPMNFCRTEVYAGTPLERRLRETGRLAGDYWGYDYEIADPRAQAAFEIAYECFARRNWGEPGLHHRAMDVDYEYQLLAHFYGGDPALRRRTKGFVLAVNRNTCAHLTEILAHLAAGVPDEATRRAFGDDLRRRVHADDARLIAESDGILAGIRAAVLRGAAGRGLGSRRSGRVVAAAGLAAAAALGLGCKRDGGTNSAGPDQDHQVEPTGEPDATLTQIYEEAPLPVYEPPPPVEPSFVPPADESGEGPGVPDTPPPADEPDARSGAAVEAGSAGAEEADAEAAARPDATWTHRTERAPAPPRPPRSDP